MRKLIKKIKIKWRDFWACIDSLVMEMEQDHWA